MLGNFSFGDYFKKDDPFCLSADRGVGMPPDAGALHLQGDRGIPRDEEAYELWKQYVPADRILEPAWTTTSAMGTPARAALLEIYYVRGSGSDPEIEIWNNVFMEFERSADGTLTDRPRSIDTGMGLERLTAVLQRKDSNYDTDLFTPILAELERFAGRAHTGSDGAEDISMRVVADHIRATTFLIADGVIPSNEWRGYVLRKIMRRAMRHGKHLGITEPFLHRLVAVLDREMGDAYPEVRTNRGTVEQTILAEERRFDTVLTDGLPRLESEIAKALESPDRVLSGDAAFRLYDTFGLPYDFIEDTAATQDVAVDREGYERAMAVQRTKARSGQTFALRTKDSDVAWTMEGDRADELAQMRDQFDGYDRTRVPDAQVVAVFASSGREVSELREGESGYIALSKTPFYLESGGQVSDVGFIRGTDGQATVDGLLRVRDLRHDQPRRHHVILESGRIGNGDIVTAEVDAEARDATRRNHTATHLLHAALREVLGGHVKAAGRSWRRIACGSIRPFPGRHCRRTGNGSSASSTTRFAATPRWTRRNGSRTRPWRPARWRCSAKAWRDGARRQRAGLQHGVVRRDACPRNRRHRFLRPGRGERRRRGRPPIEAVTGEGAAQWAQQQRASLVRLVSALHVHEDQAVETVAWLLADNKRLAREATQLKTKLALGGGSPAEGDGAIEIGGVKLARRRVSGLDKDALRGLADSLKAQIKSGVVIIASENDGKVQIVVAVTSDLTSRVKAGQIVKEIAPLVGGGGGGRPDFAEAGGKQPEKIDEMLGASEGVVARFLG